MTGRTRVVREIREGRERGTTRREEKADYDDECECERWGFLALALVVVDASGDEAGH